MKSVPYKNFDCIALDFVIFMMIDSEIKSLRAQCKYKKKDFPTC